MGVVTPSPCVLFLQCQDLSIYRSLWTAEKASRKSMSWRFVSIISVVLVLRTQRCNKSFDYEVDTWDSLVMRTMFAGS